MSYTVNLPLSLLSYPTLMSIENDVSEEVVRLKQEFMSQALALAEGNAMSYMDTQRAIQVMKQTVDDSIQLKELLTLISQRMKEIQSNT